MAVRIKNTIQICTIRPTVLESVVFTNKVTFIISYPLFKLSLLAAPYRVVQFSRNQACFTSLHILEIIGIKFTLKQQFQINLVDC